MALTAEQMRNLIEARVVTLKPGLELLDENDVYISDITDRLRGSSSQVTYAEDDGIKTKAKLTILGELDWPRQRLKPYLTIVAPTGFEVREGVPILDENGDPLLDENGDVLLDNSPVGLIRADVAERFNLGVFMMATPVRRLNERAWNPTTRAFDRHVYDVECYDKLQLLNVPYGETFQVKAGDPYLAAAVDMVIGSGPGATRYAADATAAAKVAVSNLDFLRTERKTRLEIANACLDAIGYRSLWCDREGQFRLSPIVDASVAATMWEYRAGRGGVSPSPVAPDRTETVDVFNTPNVWDLWRDDPSQDTPTTDNGRFYQENLDYGPASINSRGGWRVIHSEGVNAADQVAFDEACRQIVATTRLPARTIELKTKPNPNHWIDDVVTYLDRDIPTDPDLATTDRFRVTSWVLPLQDMMTVTLAEVPLPLPQFLPVGGAFAGGNTVVDIGDYRIHTFTSSGTLTLVTAGPVDVLVIGGGGSGGGKQASTGASGGGGAGQWKRSTLSVTDNVTVTVGAGGTTPSDGVEGNDGTSSSFGPTLVAVGGGGGGTLTVVPTTINGRPGGAGGGGGGSTTTPGTGGAGSSGGYPGGAGTNLGSPGGGGGGGAGGPGALGATGPATAGTKAERAAGGTGLAFDYSGSTVVYCHGGRGGLQGSGGTPGGYEPPEAGTANTGNGGDGDGWDEGGKAGGSGIVIVRYIRPST